MEFIVLPPWPITFGISSDDTITSIRMVLSSSDSNSFTDTIGTYNPLTTPAEIKLNEESAIKWLNNGAIPTDTVKNLFSKAGIMEKYHNLKQGK